MVARSQAGAPARPGARASDGALRAARAHVSSGAGRRPHADVPGEALDLLARPCAQAVSRDVQGARRHAQAQRLDDRQPPGQADAGGGEQGVAGAAVVERLEHRRAKLENARRVVALDQHGGGLLRG